MSDGWMMFNGQPEKIEFSFWLDGRWPEKWFKEQFQVPSNDEYSKQWSIHLRESSIILDGLEMKNTQHSPEHRNALVWHKRMPSFYLNSLNDIMPPILFTPQIENNKTFSVWHKWELCFVF